MLKQDVAQAVIAEALKTGGDFAEIFLEDRLNHDMMMLSGKVESVNSRRLHGAGVRVFNGFQGVYVYTNDTSKEGLLACAKRAASAIKAQSGYTAKPLMWQETPNIHFIKEMPDTVKSARKVEKLKAADAKLKEYQEVVQARVGYTDSVQRVWIANSEGLFTTDTRVYSWWAPLPPTAPKTRPAPSRPAPCRALKSSIPALIPKPLPSRRPIRRLPCCMRPCAPAA